MLRARGLAALLDAARQSGCTAAPLGSATACQALGRAPLAAPAAGWALWSPLPSSAAPTECQLTASAWRRHLHTAAAAAASEPQAGSAAAGSSAAAVAAAAAAATAAAAGPAKVVLYRGRGMRLFRILVRMKVFQLAGIAALAIPINTFLATGSVATPQAVMAGALVVGAGVASGTLWYYSRRYVGELALLPAGGAGQSPRLRLSVLDFWGHREDNDIPLQALVPPLAALPEAAQRTALAEPLLPVDVEGDRQYFLSLRYGHVLDGATLRALLTGQLEGQALRADSDDDDAGQR